MNNEKDYSAKYKIIYTELEFINEVYLKLLQFNMLDYLSNIITGMSINKETDILNYILNNEQLKYEYLKRNNK